MNFPDQVVTDMIEPVLKGLASFGNGSMVIVIFLKKLEERHS